ncbi:autophagy-related protein 16-1 [Electrophorus electricus]|uniref:autophagy-related protein 16-1 n=1 Tax=Electrophorus electricus TaxID=8005 RepID=UPI000F09F5FB|nr:autophagy-related protein 16-1 [Electrophorus electricus]XP_026876736.1 autophagy-related protein 16-1 [Electrophorus electricus]
MEPWKSHVRAELFQRDCMQKDPFSGLCATVSRLEEMLCLHMSLLEDTERQRLPAEEENHLKLNLQLKEREHIIKELTQKVSDLTSNLYLKEAELQYCHSQVTRYRNEAVLLARGVNSLNSDISDYQYKLECQSNELAASQLEQRRLREELEVARRQKEELLERWLEEKREEAERLNKHNATQERWNRFAGRLKRLHYGRPRPPSCATSTGTNHPEKLN